MKKALLIVNPVAGKMKAKSTILDVLKVLESRDDMHVAVQITRCRGHATELAGSAKAMGYDMVICFGGDGTLNETICGLIGEEKNLPLGYIPAGSTNDFASSMKLSGIPAKAADIIINGDVHPIDVGCFNGDRYFTYVAAFGIFTATSYNVPQSLKNSFGHLAYILGSVKEIGNIRSYHVKIESNDRTVEDDFIFGAVANSTSVAGIVKLDESLVDMNDGLFEIGFIRKPKNIIELNRIVASLTTSNFNNGGMEFYKASEITVTSEGGLDWTLDGEHATGGETVTIKNINSAIRFIK